MSLLLITFREDHQHDDYCRCKEGCGYGANCVMQVVKGAEDAASAIAAQYERSPGPAADDAYHFTLVAPERFAEVGSVSDLDQDSGHTIQYLGSDPGDLIQNQVVDLVAEKRSAATRARLEFEAEQKRLATIAQASEDARRATQLRESELALLRTLRAKYPEAT